MTTPPSRLADLVSRLPEIYQPIYGHPDLSGQPSRPSLDRWKEILRVHDALAERLGRPVRVLDLGCSQGFFSLSLAEAGAIVHGMDYNEANIAVCRALATENLALRVSFAVDKVEHVLTKLEPGDYDLVLGLSVFHHLTHEHGQEAVAQMLEACAPKILCGIFELALASEPVYWAPAQPERPQEILRGFEFVHTLSHHETHLSKVQRPLIIASNRLWYLDGRLEPFDVCKTVSHHLAANNFRGSRKYFLGGQYIAKVFSLETLPHLVEANREELHAEAEFLRTRSGLGTFPRLVCHGLNDTETWLVRERIEGEILSDLIEQGQPLDPDRILHQVLDQLCALEADGIYHTDLRAWNVLMTPSGVAHIIDYGSIAARREDVVWPHNLFLAFWIFVRELATGTLESPLPQRQPFISPFNLPEPYQAWARQVWAQPTDAWSFRLIRDRFMAPGDGVAQSLDPSGGILWMRAMETYLDTLNRTLRVQSEARPAQVASPGEDPSRQDALRVTSLGEAHEAAGRQEEALGCYLQAMEAAPAFPLPFLRAAGLIERAGDAAGARRCLEAGLDHNPKDALLWEALMRMGLDHDDRGAAAKDAWDALQQLPEGGGGRWHALVAEALLAQGCLQEAGQVLARGLQASPGNPALEALRRRLAEAP